MPQVGFSCRYGNVPIKQCSTCPTRCHPLPFLHAFLRNREPKPSVYHVTDVINPLQILFLKLTRDYYCTPDSAIQMSFGTGLHRFLESSRILMEAAEHVPEHVLEAHFEVPILSSKLSGTADIWIPETKELIDVKTCKAYKVKLMRSPVYDWAHDTWARQLNIYWVFGFPEARKLTVAAWVKDYSSRIAAKDGIQEIEYINIPFLPDTARFVAERIGLIEDIMAGHTECPPCEPDEINWGSSPTGRCEKYCAVASVCSQFAHCSRKVNKERI